MPLRFIFVDFDSFFASCEQQMRPELRGKPVGVVPMMTNSTCCLAASYEAKAYGIRTGTGVAEARHLCPSIQFVVADHVRYVKIHAKLNEAVEKCIPITEVKSIDELYAELPPNWRDEETALNIAHQIKKRVAEEIGDYITCTIGIGPNIFLSKLGSGMNKPCGLNVFHDKDLPQCLYGLKLRDIYGVGRNMLKRLRARNINTVEQLCAASRQKLRSIWGGVEGERLYAELRGEIIERSDSVRRHVSHSHILPPKIRNREDAFAVIHRLTQKAALRLRKLEHYAGSLSIGIRFDRHTKWSGEVRFFQTQRTPVFLKALRQLWDSMPAELGEPMKVSMVLGQLVHAKQFTPSLFSGGWDLKGEQIEQAMDKVNLHYGPRTLYYAGAQNGMNEAPMRIAFSHIPDLEVERD
ncbi:DNA polymerase Y family protein [Rubellicoccus peritrichatus]|uniref:UmuC domain-containing protein n=1 Tax=Rubellicoccus peritrichatus TaxID=3080537 RepID=A0AAQ3LBQ1_9BACT|nr:hypothetical protein [Puniceicoccus sp. CR14]WOO41589.1 hypothetical protein RZN69_00710 [Puniceicoccus sp. CR14]